MGTPIIAIYGGLSEGIFRPVKYTFTTGDTELQSSEIRQARMCRETRSYKTSFGRDAIANNFRMLWEDLPTSFLAHSLLELIVRKLRRRESHAQDIHSILLIVPNATGLHLNN
jgi:hypothetical protein